jgi:HlyD family secretion protein
MSKSLKWILSIVVLLLVVMVVLAKAGFFGKNDGVRATAEQVQKRTIIEVVNASGKVYPEIEVKISSDISGEITELTVQEGDSVKKGQMLARIYADIYSIERDRAAAGLSQSQAQIQQSQAQASNSQAALVATKATLDQAGRTYEMQKKLYDEKIISQNELNVALTALNTARANYNAAVEGLKGLQASIRSAQAAAQSAQSNLAKTNKDLSRTAVVSPIDGVVSLMSVKKGEKVVGNSMNAGTEMLRVADMQKIEVRVDVSENDIPKVKLGDSAIVEVEAYSDRKFKGVVTQISSSNIGAAAQSIANASTSTDVTNYKVYIRIVPESYMDLIGKGSFPFKPGMSASVDIQTKIHANVLSVPINAITTREKADSLKSKQQDNMDSDRTLGDDDVEVVAFVLQPDGTVKKVKVKTSIQDINYIEVTEGLKEGESVITGPYDLVSRMLKEKDKVKVVGSKELFDKK